MHVFVCMCVMCESERERERGREGEREREREWSRLTSGGDAYDDVVVWYRSSPRPSAR